MEKEDLLIAIAERAPWYQRIDFPEFGISTTDNPEHAMLDEAWDNKIGDISLEEAAIRRPQPKWEFIQTFLPSMEGKEVLEIGSNCGFFSLKFAESGAKNVLGIDVSNTWLDKARFAASVLNVQNVEFRNVDFLNFSGSADDPAGLITDQQDNIPLPQNQFDVIFMSTVIDHLFFPLFSIYKMIKLAREYVVIDCPCTNFDVIYDRGALTLSVAKDGSHHGFVATPKFWQQFINRLGIPESDLAMNFYNNDHSVCMIIDVRNAADRLRGA